jgi:uncharacterized protein (DUF1015 family)
MAEVVPFKGVLYNVDRASAVSGEDLLAPPYDIITPEYREELYDKNPYNIVRVDFGKELPGDDGGSNRYTRAKAFLDEWLRQGILVAGTEPCFYSYEISYTIDDKQKTLRGFLGLVRLEELGKGNIHPHECTHSKPKKDRLELMRICNANISPIFSLYSSSLKKTSSVLADVNGTVPYVEARDMDGSVHRLWHIQDRVSVESIRKELEGRPVFIADGHHRYETALEYQREMREREGRTDGPKPYDYVMMFLANMRDEGLTILPTHRLIKEVPDDFLERLAPYFDREEVAGGFDIAAGLAGKRRSLGFFRSGSETWEILRYKGETLSNIPPVLAELDVSILHELILGRLLKASEIAYEMDVEKCLGLVRGGQFKAAFFLNPTRVEDVENVALASLRMPPKSTFFYPKLLTGMVLNIFKNTF